MWSKILIFSIVVGVCIAATVPIAKPEEKSQPAAEDLQTAETVGRQFGHGGSPYFGFGGYGGSFGHYPQGGFGGYGGYGWNGHHHHGGSHGGYGGYGSFGYPHGGGYGHHG